MNLTYTLKSRSTLLVVVLAVFSALVATYWPPAISDAKSRATDADAERGTTPAPIRSTDANLVGAQARTSSIAIDQDSVLNLDALDATALVGRITGAQSARNLEALLVALQAKSLEKAVTLRVNIEAMCATSRHRLLREASPSVAEPVYAVLEEYCANSNTSDAAYSRYLSMSVVDYFDVGIGNLNALRLSDGAEAAMRRAETLAVSAQDRLELDVAASQLLNGDVQNAWRFGTDDPEMALDAGSAAAIRRLALELYGCRIFSDCAGRPLRWYTHCIRTLMCAPSESYLDVLRNTHTPRQYAAAERLAAELMRMRMSGKH
jgi:hypothetical protein